MKKYRLLASIAGIGFLLNLVWENAQAPLYEGYANFREHFMVCFWASIIDAGVVVFFYGLFAYWYRDFYWIKNSGWKDMLILFLLGGLLAIVFEQWALVTGMWAYTSQMPVVFSTGLLPPLQMMLLPLMTFLIYKRLTLKP